ncbi:uncharacterized protein DUF4343 [Tahibacter aquaticus]|uniref:Uncharacterized protein DUF4343 n=1 Tax=Tahibacter aquaticus TaxID=520092 RepID=A0A4R6YU99_9GAMM|nr:uncharacterized protein DUF4343 [Tahibacter aquaticus]
MHWILQANLFKEPEWETLLAALERFGLPHSIHTVVPFVGELLPAPVLDTAKVICLGSYSMRHSARHFGWTPGIYDLFEQNFLVQKDAWGERMLNFDSQVIAFRDARLSEAAFVRPIDDSKYFAGGVFGPAEFAAWQHRVCDLNLDYGTSLTPETLIQVCRPKLIQAEYRFWIVGGQIVTRSLYKRGARVAYSSEVDERLDRFVGEAIADWQPHRAFVIDVCDTPDGPRIVEINTLNSAGFYAADVQRLIGALEDLESDSHDVAAATAPLPGRR